MPNYIRNQVYGGTYFFTLVTNNRKPYFSDRDSAEILMKAIEQTQKRKPFDLIAYCILFDHLHLLITLPKDNKSFSQRIRSIKRITTMGIREFLGKPDLIIWQERFWEHTISTELDLKHHFDYIHYNPVKHGYVKDYGDWVWSSYAHYFNSNSELHKIDPKSFEDKSRSYGE